MNCRSGRNTGKISTALLLLSIPRIDLVYTLISLSLSAMTKDCSFYITLLRIIALVFSVLAILSSPVWTRDICSKKNLLIIFGSILSIPVLAMYLLADNAKPVDCWLRCPGEQSTKCDQKLNSELRIGFLCACSLLLFRIAESALASLMMKLQLKGQMDRMQLKRWLDRRKEFVCCIISFVSSF